MSDEKKGKSSRSEVHWVPGAYLFGIRDLYTFNKHLGATSN